ncbi:GerAB/ArcD/ProY family transporter [Wukongibacter sp. M2B1]|uniref:GerAB/ArcD/ProY family transporter n=1 Tax=Wukongibacter sp. M2B1 TaxID=3088895 RepID=UPI003D7AC1F1
MDRNNDTIASSQLFSILVNAIIGVGILSLPGTLAMTAGPDSLIVLVCGSIMFLILALFIQRLISKFPQKTIIEITDFVLFKPLGVLVGICYFIYTLSLVVLEVRSFGEITKNYLLINTPIEIIIISFLLTAVYLVRSGVESIARISVIILPLSIFPAILASLVAIPDLDFTYFLPVLRTPFSQIIKTLPKVFFSFLGFEVILFLSFFVKDTKNIKKTTIRTIGFVSIVYFIFTAITIARFGIVESKNLIWPVVTLFKSVDIPGTLLENVESVIMATWLLSIFMTIVIGYFGASFLLSRILKSKEQNYFALILLPLVYTLSLIPENIVEVSDYLQRFSNLMGTIFGAALPIVLLLFSLFRKKTKKGMKKNG